MHPKQKAAVEQFYSHTQGNYETRLEQFLAIRRTASSIASVTRAEFASFIAEKMTAEEQRKIEIQIENLWKTVREWEPDPLSGLPSANPGPIFELIDSLISDTVRLGELHHNGGVHPCALLPTARGLGPLCVFYHTSGLEYSSGALAINYADGFPSDENPRLSKDQDISSDEEITFSPISDRVLRRFISLGYIMIMNYYGGWEKTGHVLVLDADHGRNSHPWIVLASEWDTDDEALLILGETEVIPPQIVALNDSDTPGVLPRDKNRTTIARLDSLHAISDGSKLVEHFGLGFKFKLERCGRERMPTAGKAYGPSLVEIMIWFWDPAEQREVCYTEDGRLRYSYDKYTRNYRGPRHLSSEKVEDWRLLT